MFIYLASPYSDPEELTRLRRFAQVKHVTAWMALARIPVFSPIVHGHTLDRYIGPLIQGDPHDFWMDQYLPMLGQASRLVILTLDGWEGSRGIEKEVLHALKAKIPTTFLHYLDIPRRLDEAITYLRNRYSPESTAPDVRPGEDAPPSRVDLDARTDAPAGSP